MNIEQFKNKTVLVTGATGLIGSALCKYLVSNSVNVIACVRNIEKAKALLPTAVKIVTVLEGKPDYIVHAAAPTDSGFFVEHPVDTIDTIVNGTKAVLEFAKNNNCVQSVAVLSSLEVYGTPLDSSKLTEDKLGYLDSMAVRSSYPEAKRCAEVLIAGYWSEYKVKAMSLRLAQCFGPGVPKDDNRVFMQFIRSAIENKNIELMTSGDSKRMYISLKDCISAILTILTEGAPGEAYNCANENNFISVFEMAKLVASTIGKGKISVKNNCGGDSTKYLPTQEVYQDTSKLQALGWKPADSLESMFIETFEYFNAQQS
jgi:nucleoside-diphosphate-sugar epimerase